VAMKRSQRITTPMYYEPRVLQPPLHRGRL
jgi:hypothetical protein